MWHDRRTPKRAKVGSATVPLCHVCEDDYALFRAASFAERVFAFGIDAILAAPLLHLSELLCRSLRFVLPTSHAIVSLSLISWTSTLLIVLGYLVIPTWKSGRTLGKHIVGIRVIDTHNHDRLGFGQVLLREIPARLLWALMLPLFLILKVRAPTFHIHDFLAQTRVVALKTELPEVPQ